MAPANLGKQVLLPSQILEQAREKLQEFSSLHKPTPPPRTTPASCWRPPDHDYVKINFDGALFSKENRPGIGVVKRNEARLVLASLSHQIPLPATVLKVETFVARRALEVATEIGVNRVILEGDSSILIKPLQGRNHS
ncbi:uncharacterized protein LOC142638332 [Castanea sativa]|uniref:uncharacterized protein LOC142638332 n=1 Tax=Castanea sativa TaxID=21020 RepID=UPI003F652D76